MRPIDADALRQKIEKCALDADRASSFSNPDGGAFYDEVLDAIPCRRVQSKRNLTSSPTLLVAIKPCWNPCESSHRCVQESKSL